MDEPIRILHMSGTMNRGGAETLIMELYRHIDRSKIQFDFMIYNYSGKCGAYDEEIKSMGGRIYEMRCRLYQNPFAYWREAKGFFDSHPEYRFIHAHQFAKSGYILSAAKKSDENRITIAHSHLAFPHTDFLRWCADCFGKELLKKYTDYYFGCSEDALVALSGHKSNGKNIILLKNAIDSEKFRFSDVYRKKWRDFLGTGRNTLVVGNVARFTYQKNHKHLLLTFKEIVDIRQDSILVLIGIGKEQDHIRHLADSLNLSEKVYFLGSRDDVHEIINAFDVFMLPSRFEGLGIVLIEAQANGLPCVISDHVIPEEADVGAGIVQRLSLRKKPAEWALACMNAPNRIDCEIAQNVVNVSGYGIGPVAKWLQDFYLNKWNP